METKTTKDFTATIKQVAAVATAYGILKARLGGLPETPTIEMTSSNEEVITLTLTTERQKATVENCGVFAHHINEFYHKFTLWMFADGSWKVDGNIWYSFLTGGSNGNEIPFRIIYKKGGDINALTVEMKQVF